MNEGDLSRAIKQSFCLHNLKGTNLNLRYEVKKNKKVFVNELRGL